MEDKELICEYCKVAIKETDHKCPNCGANCTKVINAYKKQKKQEQDLIDENNRELRNKIIKGFSISYYLTFVLAAIIIFAVIGVFVFTFFRITKNNDRFYDRFSSIKSNNGDSNQKKVIVKFNEEAKTNEINVTLDSYELYEHKNDTFPNDTNGNTKDGYQKIAFHFIIKNNTDDVFDTRFDAEISLTADDYKVDSADLEKCYFCHTVVGKDSYQNLYGEIASGEKLQGYAGFLVPKDREKLKFKVGDNIIINMDNPVYQQ